MIDFIDMVLESNRELVLRRLLECLARDRTKHQVAEVTSLGLVQMTRKRVGSGLLEAFSETLRVLQRARRDRVARADRAPPSRRPGPRATAARRRRAARPGAARTARSPAAERPSQPRRAGTAASDSGYRRRGCGPDEAGRRRRRGQWHGRRRRCRGWCRERTATDADGAGRGVRRAPTAPGCHPRAGPARARQPAASRCVAGWLGVRRRGIRRQAPDPSAPQAGEPGASRSRGARSRGARCRGAGAVEPMPWSLTPWSSPVGRREPGGIPAGSLVRMESGAVGPGALDGEAGGTPAPGDPGSTPAVGDSVVTGRPHSQQRADLRALSDNLAHRMDTGWRPPGQPCAKAGKPLVSPRSSVRIGVARCGPAPKESPH